MPVIKRKEQTEILEISIRELTNKYNFYNGIHNQLRVRVLALLAALVAGATYVYSDISALIPEERYGFVLFLFGTAILIGVFMTLLKLIQTIMWHSPVEIKEIQRADVVYSSKLQYLKFIQDDYITAVQGNSAMVGKRATQFNNCVYALVISAIILVAIKGG